MGGIWVLEKINSRKIREFSEKTVKLGAKLPMA